VLVALWAAAPAAERGDGSAAVIIPCASSCEATAAAVRSAGGQVTVRYQNVNALAASIPIDRLPDLTALAGSAGISRDYVAPVPRANEEIGPAGESRMAVTALTESELTGLADEDLARLKDFGLNGYILDNTLTGAATLHAANNRGQGVIVAVIDSGSANTPLAPALAGSIIGGESFVTSEPFSATSAKNDPHGTRVASMIAGHGSFVFRNTAAFIRALQAHAPSSVIPCQGANLVLSCPVTSSVVPMVGTAPEARIYALKVADSRGGGVPESRLIAAMDRVITLRRNFNTGMPSVPVAGNGSEENPFVYNSLKIEVVNMSIGGPTLFAGHTVGERLTLEMLDQGIVVVATAGNNGPAAMTLGNPGSGRGALAVGAMSSYIHERILRDVQFGAGLGALLRPFPVNQTASFSSRGPTADGRLSPDIVANGMGSFAPAANSLDLVSGTSYAAPSVAGAAALLRRHAPWASAVQIRNALIESANASAIGDGSSGVDRGRGLLDIPAAAALLDAAAASEVLAQGLREGRVATNIGSVGLSPIAFVEGTFSTRVQSLLPGQVAHFFVPTDLDTRTIRVRVTDIVIEAPAEQNQVFGDDLLVQIVDAPTSLARKHAEAFIDIDSSFIVERPQPGLMRVALAGAFSNGGPVSATMTIERTRKAQSGKDTASGKVRQGQLLPIKVDVPAGTQTLTFDLSWRSHWGRYPTADLDLVLVNPLGESVSVTTLDSPERFTIQAPVPGAWKISVHGFAIQQPEEPCEGDDCDGDEDKEDERFDLRVFADGRLLRDRR
jgi:subtilisin family serine protease